ncbi:YD repeat protein [Isoalcanivorax pacificus W11-5]|uniref:YD repeat protein n=1 Tax=Isoalcanivorax pacificus W11-5 TaxID=391936 RepID=A0A0B4XMS8_9GAMM|nr:hypothetical protein [Isoalcanivorax pacificus]AJD47637.1 YD repeat protein [Isoalcanivorax pacificus W11-5]
MKSSVILILFLPVIMMLSGGGAQADPLDVENLLPDFYSDPSLSASIGYFGDVAQVTVDKFSGKLVARAEDVVVPGNGGLDIILQRTYTSLDPGVIPEYSYLGAGWSMHYGQIRITDPDRMCSRLWSTTMSGNPVYVAGDGSTRALAFVTLPVSADLGAEYVSSRNDLVYCNQDGTFYMRSPDGRRYDFDAFSYEPDTAYPAVWYVTKVTDRNGNTLDISYVPTGTLGGMGMVMTQISAGDGRIVTFAYQGSSGDSVVPPL